MGRSSEFPNKTVDVPSVSPFHRDLLARGWLVRIYLDEIEEMSSPEMGILQLITCPVEEAAAVVEKIRSVSSEGIILEFIRTVLVYKFPHWSREEIERMFTLDDLRKTRVFQEAQQEQALSILGKQISRKFGTLPQGRLDQLQSLSLDRLEALAEALLEFNTINDLYQWLDSINAH